MLLKRSNLSYKRAQRKPTKADKAEQEVFKKNAMPSLYCRKFF
ncbi:winged helix-turn-helix domain-containing protein [Clostridium beijerinckii]